MMIDSAFSIITTALIFLIPIGILVYDILEDLGWLK